MLVNSQVGQDFMMVNLQAGQQVMLVNSQVFKGGLAGQSAGGHADC